MRKTVLTLLLISSVVSLFALDVDWSKAETVQKNVQHLYFYEKSPRPMQINIMRIDLSTPGLKFTATEKDQDYGKPMPDYPKMTIVTKREKTVDFMLRQRKTRNMIVAANASPWRPWTKPWTHIYGYPESLNILDGEVLCGYGKSRATFAVYKDGKAVIARDIPVEDYPDITIAVSGFEIILQDGKIIEQAKRYQTATHPRIVYGLSRDKRYFYILTVNGRQPGVSEGATAKELSHFMQDAGAWDAVNMDGGGSTSLCYWNEQEKKPVFLPHHKRGVQRYVGSNIGIYLE